MAKKARVASSMTFFGGHRALEETKGQVKGQPTRRLKEPKRASHKRTIKIDDALVNMLCAERAKHQRLEVGDPDGIEVDLVKLPDDALMFPSLSARGLDFTKLRDARAVTRNVEKQARKRFPGLRLHDLRGSHETALVDAGVPVHVVAARCAHDPAELLRTYAKRTKKADNAAALAIGKLLGGALGD